MLLQAAEFLESPQLFTMEEAPLSEYYVRTREKYLVESMHRLELIGRNTSCKSGFWRRLKKAAQQLGQNQDAQRYEVEFHASFE